MLAFSPERLDIARQRRGLTKRRLAEEAGITPTSLHRYASLRRVPEPEIVDRFASTLDFPKEFFFGQDLDLPPVNGTSYRALSRATARHRMQAEAVGALGILFSGWIHARFNLPLPDIPEYDIDDPEVAAEAVRASWGLGVLSITNMVALLENHGVRVFSLATDTPYLDAFSFWHALTPYVFLNTNTSKTTAERLRMDVAHELGHLVLHFKGGAASRDRQAEHDARRFAGAFLIPESSVAANFPLAHLASLDQFRESKRFWNVSVTSLIVRMRELGYLTDYRYRALMVEASMRGYRQNEPDECNPDFSAVLDRLFNPYREDSENARTAAQAMHVHADEVYNLMRGLVPFPIPVP